MANILRLLHSGLDRSPGLNRPPGLGKSPGLEKSPGLDTSPGLDPSQGLDTSQDRPVGVRASSRTNSSSFNHSTDTSTDSVPALNDRHASSPSPRRSSEISTGSLASSRGLHFNPLSHQFPPSLPIKIRLIPQPPPLGRVRHIAADPSTPSQSGPGSGSTSASVSYSEEGEGDGETNDTGDGEFEVDRRDGRPGGNGDITHALWIRLQDQRSITRELRGRLSAKRARLRELRKQNGETDNRFMSLLRPHFAEGNRVTLASDLAMQRFTEMQTVRSAYHLVEDEVERLEIELDDEERSREILETQFLSHIHTARGSEHRDPSPPESEIDGYAPPSRTSLLGIPSERPVDIHPLYRRLLDAVGDRELAREHLMDLVVHRDSILYNLDLAVKRGRLRAAEGHPDLYATITDEDDFQPWQVLTDEPDKLDEIYDRYKSVIDEDDYAFLKSFSEVEAEAKKTLENAKDEVEQLKEQCTQYGVMRKNAPFQEEYTLFSQPDEAFPETMSVDDAQALRPGEGLTNARFPVFLSNPRHLLESEPLTAKEALRRATRMERDNPSRAQLVGEAMKEYGISTLLIESAGENKSDYINRWLLHRLRTSPMEALLIYSIFSMELKVRNMRRWQEDVLYFWPRDKANLPSHELVGPITPRDSLILDDSSSEHLNSILDVSSRPQSDMGETPNHPSPPPSRPVQSVC